MQLDGGQKREQRPAADEPREEGQQLPGEPNLHVRVPEDEDEELGRVVDEFLDDNVAEEEKNKVKRRREENAE